VSNLGFCPMAKKRKTEDQPWQAKSRALFGRFHVLRGRAHHLFSSNGRLKRGGKFSEASAVIIPHLPITAVRIVTGNVGRKSLRESSRTADGWMVERERR